MDGSDPAFEESVLGLRARLEAAEHLLAERDKTIEALISREKERAATLPSTLSVLEENAALQQAITRKNLELEAQNRKLEQSEERFFTAFEHAPIGVALVSPEGHWIKVNRALCEAVGRSEAELLTRTFQDITHPDDLELDLESMRQVWAGELASYQIEKRCIHGSGHFISVLLSVMLVRDHQNQPLYFISQIQDITARKEAEAQLRASKEKLRQIFDYSTQIFYSHTVDGQITYVSPRVWEILECSPEEALQPWTDFLTDNPINKEGIIRTNQAISTAQRQPPYLLELKSKHGRLVWVEIHEAPVVADGKTVAIVGALTDVTARIHAEAKQRTEEERFVRQRNALIAFTAIGNQEDLPHTIRRLTETAARTLRVARVSVWRYNADRTAIHCVDLYELDQARHTAGMELTAASFPAYFRALASMDVIAANDAPQDARTCEFTEIYLRPLRISSMLDAPIHLAGAAEGVLCHEHIGPARQWTADEETFAVAVANRLSLALEGAERQQAGQELRSAHAQLGQMLAYSAAIIYRLKVEGHSYMPVAVSANITSILGFELAEVLNPQWWCQQLHPEDRDRAMSESSQAAGQNSSSQYRVRHKEGGYRWIEDNRRVFRNTASGTMEIIGVWTDITARKQSEAALEKSHQELIDVSRQAGMAEVATAVLHNVGNVLNSVNVSVSLAGERVQRSSIGALEKVAALLREQAADLPGFFASDSRAARLTPFLEKLGKRFRKDQEALLEEMNSLAANVDHIKQIVAMQQSYARVAGVVETLPPAELLEDALRLNAGAFERHKVEVVREYGEVPPIPLEKHKIIQVLVNLIRNAKDACHESERPDKRVWLRIARNGGGFIHITVADNGIGIPAENLTRIFEHGFTTRSEGHGWGLHTSALTAKELGGRLRAESDGPGQGATFTLELPVGEKEVLP